MQKSIRIFGPIDNKGQFKWIRKKRGEARKEAKEEELKSKSVRIGKGSDKPSTRERNSRGENEENKIASNKDRERSG